MQNIVKEDSYSVYKDTSMRRWHSIDWTCKCENIEEFKKKLLAIIMTVPDAEWFLEIENKQEYRNTIEIMYSFGFENGDIFVAIHKDEVSHVRYGDYPYKETPWVGFRIAPYIVNSWELGKIK